MKARTSRINHGYFMPLILNWICLLTRTLNHWSCILGRQEGWPLTSPEHYLDKQYSLKTFWYRKLPILSLPDSRIPFWTLTLDALGLNIWRPNSHHVMFNLMILFDVTSLTVDHTTHDRCFNTSDWISLIRLA